MTNSYFSAVCEIELHDVVHGVIFADEFIDTPPREWTKLSLITLEDAMEGYMVDLIAKSDMQMLQLISCRFSTCLQL